MEGRRVKISIQVWQVKKGWQYKGTLKVEMTEFDFDMAFGVEIEELEKIEEGPTQEELRELFKIKIWKNKKEIDLTWDDFSLFFGILSDPVIDLYFHPLALETNKNLLEPLSKGQGPLGKVGGVVASMGMDHKMEVVLNAEQLEVLSANKFGIIFPDA